MSLQESALSFQFSLKHSILPSLRKEASLHSLNWTVCPSTQRNEPGGSPLTSRTSLFALLDLLPLGELAEGLRSFLEFGDEELNVVQDVVQDLLPN